MARISAPKRLRTALVALAPIVSACGQIDLSVDWNEVFSDLSRSTRKALPPLVRGGGDPSDPSASGDPEAVDEAPIASDPSERGKRGPSDAPTVARGAVDLGLARYPVDSNGKPIGYAFDVSELAPRAHRVAYAASSAEIASVQKFYAAYARSVEFKPTGDNSFSWAPPPGCPNDMGCVYAALIRRTRADLEPLARRFLARVHQAKYDALQTAELVLAFVQAIPYVIPNDPFGLRPPTLTLAEKGGDCDTKALLLHMLLADLGIDSVIVSSTAHAHTMLAVALPAHGTTFVHQGRRYAFAETTAIGSVIGHINPELLRPNDWRVEFAPKDGSE